jgi:hypothetical protein
VTYDSLRQLSSKLNERKVNSGATSVNYQLFKACVKEQFNLRPPPEHFTEALFNRFRPFRIKQHN